MPEGVTEVLTKDDPAHPFAKSSLYKVLDEKSIVYPSHLLFDFPIAKPNELAVKTPPKSPRSRPVGVLLIEEPYDNLIMLPPLN